MSNYNVCELFCNNCNFKKIIDTNEKLAEFFEIKVGTIPNGGPKVNAQTKKIETPKELPQKRKFRCPTCGFAITSRLVPDTQKILDAKIEEERLSLERKKLEENARDHSIRKPDENRIDGSEAGITGLPIS